MSSLATIYAGQTVALASSFDLENVEERQIRAQGDVGVAKGKPVDDDVVCDVIGGSNPAKWGYKMHQDGDPWPVENFQVGNHGILGT